MDRSDEDGVSSSQTDGDLARAENGFVSPSPANGPPALRWQTVVPAAHRHSPFRRQVEQERFFPSLPPPQPPPPFCGDIYSTPAPPFALCQAMGPQITVDAKALAASKSHCEAERRRRERINGHLARLRSLLPSTTKTDKASLLAEVIAHVKALKRQTSVIAGESPLPTEADELTVDAAAEDDEGRLVITASLCCDDRPGLLAELIRALKSLRLRALKAEITTLAGRVKNVLVITAVDGEYPYHRQPSVAAVQDLLKSVMERTSPAADDPAAAGGIKQQRTAA